MADYATVGDNAGVETRKFRPDVGETRRLALPHRIFARKDPRVPAGVVFRYWVAWRASPGSYHSHRLVRRQAVVAQPFLQWRFIRPVSIRPHEEEISSVMPSFADVAILGCLVRAHHHRTAHQGKQLMPVQDTPVFSQHI